MFFLLQADNKHLYTKPEEKGAFDRAYNGTNRFPGRKLFTSNFFCLWNMCIKQVLDSFSRKIEKKTLATSLSITSEKLPNNEFSMQKTIHTNM